jgi:hypothetical protein
MTRNASTHRLLLPLCQQGHGARTFSWNGSSANNWATTGNCVKTGTASRDTYPGETSGQQINDNELSRVTNFYLYNKF